MNEKLILKIQKQQEYIIKTINNKKIKNLLMHLSKANNQSKNKIDVFDSIFIPNENYVFYKIIFVS